MSSLELGYQVRTMFDKHNDNDFGEVVRCFYDMRQLVKEAFSGLLYEEEYDKITERVAVVLRENPEYAAHFLTSEERGE